MEEEITEGKGSWMYDVPWKEGSKSLVSVKTHQLFVIFLVCIYGKC